MAEGKKSFVMYCEWQELFTKLDDAQSGRLIKHIFAYVNDQNPEPPDVITDIAFTQIKQQFKRDLKKYEAIAERNRSNGRNGGRPESGPLRSAHNEIVPEETQGHFLYLIHDVNQDTFKIGETQNLVKRRYSIKKPTKSLRVYHFVLMDAYSCQQAERKFIQHFSDHRMSGDWFDFDEETLAEALSFLNREKTQWDNLESQRLPENPIKDKGKGMKDKGELIKEKETLEYRKVNFQKKISPHVGNEFSGIKFERSDANDFYNYWSEKNENGKKMRFEMQKVFDVKKRILTWCRNKKSIANPKDDGKITAREMLEGMLKPIDEPKMIE